MAGNYIIVADFCDQAGQFLKFEKNRHIATRKLQFRFGSALKLAVFGFVLKTVTALISTICHTVISSFLQVWCTDLCCYQGGEGKGRGGGERKGREGVRRGSHFVLAYGPPKG